MTPNERRNLTVLGGVAGVLLVVLLVVMLTAGGDGNDGERVAAGRSTTSTSGPAQASTTIAPVDLAPIAGPPSTAPPTTASAPRPPSTTSTTLPVAGPQGAVLAPPARSAARPLGPSGTCESLASAGWSVRCDFFDTRAGRFAWIIETQDTESARSARRISVLKQRAPATVFDVVLQAGDEDGSRFSAVSAEVVDVSSDGSADLAVGFRRVGAAQVLSVDLVELEKVVVHRDLVRGSARVSKGQFDSWAADPSAAGSYMHDVIRFVDRAWRVVASSREAGPPPPSQL